MTINAKAIAAKNPNREIPREIQALLPDLDPESDDALLKRVDNPTQAPKTELIKYWKEAKTMATIITPREFSREIKRLCENRRGLCKKEEFMSNGKVVNL